MKLLQGDLMDIVQSHSPGSEGDAHRSFGVGGRDARRRHPLPWMGPPLWFVIGAGYSLAQTPSGRLLRRSSHPEDRPAVFAAQFALSHACWLVTYPLAGYFADRIGDFAKTGDWSLLAAYLPSRILFGAVHALTPGHSKAVLATYLTGSTASVPRGLAVSLVLSIVHVGISVLIALLSLPLVSVALNRVVSGRGEGGLVQIGMNYDDAVSSKHQRRREAGTIDDSARRTDERVGRLPSNQVGDLRHKCECRSLLT